MLLSLSYLTFYFVRWPWLISLNYRNWSQLCVSLLRSSFLLILGELVTPAEALQVRTADSTSELDLSAITQFSSDQERPSVFLSENLLFREAGWVLPSIKQEMRVVLYVSWKHITAFLWIMQHLVITVGKWSILCVSVEYFLLHTIYRTLNTVVRRGSVIATLIPTRYIV